MSSRSYSACVLCRRVSGLRTMYRRMSTVPQPQAQVDFLNGNRHKKHPGVTNLKTLRLPEELQVAALSIIQRAQVPHLVERAQKLVNFLWSRKRPVEDSALRKKALSLEKELTEKAIQEKGYIEPDILQENITRKVLKELKRTTYRWTPMKYDEELGVVYMAARLSGIYAAVTRAMNEIKRRDTSFAPQSLLDFGSGLGAVVWASHLHWPDTLKEMVCVDSSGPMNVLAERLLRGDDENREPRIKQVYFRQFLPVSPKVQFDLVTAAFTLSELPSVKEREDAAFTLWRKTSNYLLLVENGTKEGHQILMEARDTLLKKQENIVHDTRPASVFAPCPHELICPKLASEPIVPCNFLQRYIALPRPGHNEQQIEKFSFLILKRAESEAESETDGVEWGRLIAPVMRRTRHVHCRMCCPDGQLQHVVVTARQHSKDLYRCARSSDWGDRLPVIQKGEDDAQSDSE